MSNFSRRVPGAGLLAALVVLVGSGKADAALGIVVTETTLMPVDNPRIQFNFALTLVAGNQLLQGDNITFYDIPSFNGNASYVFESGGFNFSPFFSIVASPGSGADLTNIALVYNVPPPSSFFNSMDPLSDLPIGVLKVTTSLSFPPASGSPVFTPLVYTTQTHLLPPSNALNFGTGITASPTVVPEPASLALMGVGLASAGLLARRRRAAAA